MPHNRHLLLIHARAYTLGALVIAYPARAQRTERDGGLFLLLPVGARAVAMGESATASRVAGEAVWWNPAGIVAAAQRATSLHHSQSYAGIADAISLVVPSHLIGTAAVSVLVVQEGEVESRDADNNLLGTLLARDVVISASYAATFPHDVSLGVTLKHAEMRADCSGLCLNGSRSVAATTALDAGMMWKLPDRWPITAGAVIRNLGPPLQVNDGEQSDPIPTRVQVGAECVCTPKALGAAGGALHVSLDAMYDGRTRVPLPRAGAEIAWEGRAFVRAGYAQRRSEDARGRASWGVGYRSKRLQIELSQVVGGFGAAVGQAPTHLSLRLQHS